MTGERIDTHPLNVVPAVHLFVLRVSPIIATAKRQQYNTLASGFLQG